MNSDERERLKQIQERQIVNVSTLEVARPTPGEFKQAMEDIDFLLYQLDSQAATRPVGWISCGLRHGHDRIVDIVFENADCAKAFIDGVEPAVGPIVAATRMRDLCVEKVREIHEGRLRDLRALTEQGEIENEDAEYERAVLFVLSNVIDAIQSLTLDQVEEKHS